MENRREAETIFHEALLHEPTDWDSFLLDRCGNNSALREEVRSLLASHRDAEAFEATLQAAVKATLVPSGIGRFEKLEPIGRGATGIVYQAWDPKIGRKVAIKVLHEGFTHEAQAQARKLGAVDHPNICKVFDVDDDYLVMEFVDGGHPKGPLPVDTALKYALQITNGLNEAHQRRIVHRDLKPGNILITNDGNVKILDFGLAKVLKPAISPGEDSSTFTISRSERTPVGTYAYMSPEQARGESVDKRTDIWAFGAVLYEMLTGNKVFSGATREAVLEGIFSKEPNWKNLPSTVPLRLRRLLQRCLTKERTERLEMISQAHAEIEKILGSRRRRVTAYVKPVAIAFLVIVGVGLAIWRLSLRSTLVEQRTPNHAAYDLYLNGRNLLRDGSTSIEYLNAIGMFESALKLDPHFCTAEAAIVDADLALYKETKKPDWLKQAQNTSAHVVEACPNVVAVQLSLGSLDSALGQYENAVRILAAVGRGFPESDEPSRRLGFAYQRWGRSEAAIGAYENAVKINPHYWNDHLQLGNAYFKFGHNDLAFKEYNSVVELEPSYSIGYEGIANVHNKEGQFADAVNDYKAEIAKTKPTSETYSNLGTALFFSQQYKDAIEAYETAINLAPDNGINHMNLGDAYSAAKEPEKARKEYNLALALVHKELSMNPRSAGAMGNQALLHAKVGLLSGAIKEIDDVCREHPKDPDLMYSRAVILTSAKQDGDAIELLKRVVNMGYSVKQIVADPSFDSLRNLHAFQDLVRTAVTPGR